MTQEDLRKILERPDRLSSEQLPDLMALSRQYPYSAPLHILILLCLHKIGDLRFSSELQQRVLYVPDLAHLFLLLDSKGRAGVIERKKTIEEWDEADPQDGFELINNFLEDHPDDTGEIDYILSLGTPENKKDQGPQESTIEYDSDDLIENFLKRGTEAEIITLEETSVEEAATEAQEVSENELLTETLAKIYIRQGKYERALRILKQINLEYPKKSGYFAQQINFLEKLIRNNQN